MVSLGRNAKYLLRGKLHLHGLFGCWRYQTWRQITEYKSVSFCYKNSFFNVTFGKKYHKNALLHTKMLTLCAKKTIKMNFSPRKYIAFRLGILHEYHNMNMLGSRGNFVACITVFQNFSVLLDSFQICVLILGILTDSYSYNWYLLHNSTKEINDYIQFGALITKHINLTPNFHINNHWDKGY